MTISLNRPLIIDILGGRLQEEKRENQNTIQISAMLYYTTKEVYNLQLLFFPKFIWNQTKYALNELKFERKFVYFGVTTAATELLLFMYVRFTYMVS